MQAASLQQLSTSMQPNDCAQSSLNHSTEPSVVIHAHEPMGNAQPEPNDTAVEARDRSRTCR